MRRSIIAPLYIYPLLASDRPGISNRRTWLTLLGDENMTLTWLRPVSFPTEIPALKRPLRSRRTVDFTYGPAPEAPGPPGRLFEVMVTVMTLLAS